MIAVRQKDGRKLNASFPTSLCNVFRELSEEQRLKSPLGKGGLGRGNVLGVECSGPALEKRKPATSPFICILYRAHGCLVSGTSGLQTVSRAGLVVSRGSLLSLS